MAKEAAESRARLHGLSNEVHRERNARRLDGSDIRRRQLGDIAAILGGRSSKRRKAADPEKVDREERRHNTSSGDDEPEINAANDKRRRHKCGEDDEGYRSRSHRSRRRPHRSVSEDRTKDRDDYRKRHRSRSPREHRDKESRHRHRSPKRKRSVSRDPDSRKERSYVSKRHRRSPSIEENLAKKIPEKSAKIEEPKADDDSDPLDDIIGPRPLPIQQVRSRGRGAISQASGIDSRFSSDYDPTVDVQIDPDEEDDWDQALEALRDRQKWKQQGADRLKAAGFSEDEIGKWKNGGQKREEDVKWATKGEKREWDRGKVVDDDGIVSLEPIWGRLKDT